MLFAQKVINQTNEGTVYLIPQEGEGEIDFYYLLLVPTRKSKEFEDAISTKEVVLEDYGRVLYFGSGSPSSEQIKNILREQGIQLSDS